MPKCGATRTPNRVATSVKRYQYAIYLFAKSKEKGEQKGLLFLLKKGSFTCKTQK